MSTILIRNGRVIDPSRYLDEQRDLWIVDGRLAPEGYRAPKADETIEAADLVVMPGLVDVHVHLREPGNEVAETIASGCEAALAGGFTSIIAMPNTTPALDTPDRVRHMVEKAAQVRGPHVYAMAAITEGRQGRKLADIEALARAGAIGFTDDGAGLQDEALAEEALRRCAALGRRLAEHCEVAALVEGGVMHRGAVAARAGLPGIPPEAEWQMVERDLLLAERTRAPLHLQHLSTAHAVGLVRDARARGVNVSAEATPHHLVLTDEDAAAGGADFKMNPPLRTARDMEELRRGLRDGALDIIATDHAPHTAEAKAQGFRTAPFGVIGMETALAVVFTDLVLGGWLSLAQMVERMSTAPATAFGLPAGSLLPGRPADVTVFDPAARWIVRPAAFRSKSRNCPFAGRTVQGRVAATIVAGEVRYRADLR